MTIRGNLERLATEVTARHEHITRHASKRLELVGCGDEGEAVNAAILLATSLANCGLELRPVPTAVSALRQRIELLEGRLYAERPCLTCAA